jgi:hypothetical protein
MKPPEHPLSSLFAAAMALPIVAIPVVVNAQQNAQPSSSSSLLPAGAAVGVRSLWYREDGNRMKITEPVVWLKTPVGEQWEIGGSATVDMVSGASPIITSNATGQPAQIYTGASITDRRKAYDVNVTRKYGELNENTVGVSFARSDEKDYESKAYGLNTTFDFNERNTTLALGIGSRNDRVMSVTDRTLNRARDAKEVLVGVTQIIDRRTLVQSNLVYTKMAGYLNDPYKLTFSLYRDGLSPRVASVRDSRPESRAQIAWLTRGKRAIAGMDAVVSAEYRFYRDDWGIRSHTLAGTWLQTVNDTWQVEGGLRYYSQSQADFYRREITQRPIPTISSSDQRLAGFGAFEPSIKIIAKIGDNVSVDLSFSRYMQRGTWKLGGSQGEYEPLSARLINAGLVYRF